MAGASRTALESHPHKKAGWVKRAKKAVAAGNLHRHPLAVVLSYLAFFACIRLWLSCISSFRQSKSSAADWIDLADPLFQGKMEHPLPSFRSGGGHFRGAGTTGSLANHGQNNSPPRISTLRWRGNT
jgi:hypothetical protein